MSDMVERLRKLEEAAKADEAFASALAEANDARDVDEIIRLAATKDVILSVEDFDPSKLAEREVDEAELEAVAGGYSAGDFVDDIVGVGTCIFYFLAAFSS